MENSGIKIVNSGELDITVKSSKIVRDNFISFTQNGKKHSIDAMFDLEKLPEEARGIAIQLICELRGLNLATHLRSGNEAIALGEFSTNTKQEKRSLWSKVKFWQ